MARNAGDAFPPSVKDALTKRASYICSNPDCRNHTIAPTVSSSSEWTYTGKAAHITAASPGGPRYDPSLTSEERSGVSNGVFLCSNCAEMIDKNQGKDYPVELLVAWRKTHEEWTRQNLNKSATPSITIIDGEHSAKGKGTITGVNIEGEPVQFQPGTIVSAEGEGTVTGTRITNKREDQ